MSVRLKLNTHVPDAVPPEKGLPIFLEFGAAWAADIEDLVKRTTSAVVRNKTAIPQSNIP
jgi:hypothetical protein